MATNSMIFWAWESIIHHMYFIVLFVQRQFSDKWEQKLLWKVNMEKECNFFSLLFGGDASFCAEATSSLFAGLWFRVDKPNGDHLNWIGRLITNYQHNEAIFHFTIVIFGLIIVAQLGSVTKKTKEVAAGVSGFVRWVFFCSMAFEVYTMCVPYLFLFAWVWTPFVESPKNGLVDFIESFNQNDSFLTGIQFGAALITMFWVSVVVLILDMLALIYAWNFARNGKSNLILSSSLWAIFGSAIVALMIEFFSPTGRGGTKNGEISYTEIVCDMLHHMYGGDKTSMRSLMN